ncbi:sensor histidine kinase [Parapedobacter lycopersici]|uniref:sensor histidine kinase n=1 Tax=Parapedobacter lycopersici TaxID=1864939 RepID=UPI00214D7A9C|nr:histidine kinase [Parapedobacter lycopersici]
MKPNRFSIVFHVVGWLIYVLLTWLSNAHVGLWFVLKVIVGIAPLFYCVYYIVAVYVPVCGWPRGGALLVLLFPGVLGYTYGWVYGILPYWGARLQRPEATFSLVEFVAMVGLFYLRLVVYAILLNAVRRGGILLAKRIKAEKERNRIRDSLLRFQISPHFQQNALNVIAANAATNRDHTTGEMVTIMASLQRYCMEATTGRLALVAVSREAAKLREFVKLVCLRYGGQPVMQLTVSGAPAAESIPPLTLLTGADNMVRHGVLTATHPGRMQLVFGPDGYTFRCRNRIAAKGEDAVAGTGGQGLANIRERLELLLPGQYMLETRKEGEEFISELTITHTPHESKHDYLRGRRR